MRQTLDGEGREVNMEEEQPSDSVILDWIEAELGTHLGCGDFWHVMHEVHKGQPLRVAAEAHMHFASKMKEMGIERRLTGESRQWR